jgi:hypothetical protein
MDWLFLLLNLMVSTFVAGQAGSMWAESQAAGGGTRLIAWGGALQATLGFLVGVPTLLYAGMDTLHIVPSTVLPFVPIFESLNEALPIAGAAVAVLLGAWDSYFRDRTVENLSAASTATLDMLHKLYSTTGPIAGAFGSLSIAFTPKEYGGTESPTARLAGQGIAIVALLLISGFFIARGILMYYAKKAGAAYVTDQRIQSVLAS